MKRRPSPWRAIRKSYRLCATGWPPTVSPQLCSTRRALPAPWKQPIAAGSTASTDELIHKAGAQPHFFIMGAAEVDLGEDILIAQDAAIGIDIDHHAIDLEKRDHL